MMKFEIFALTDTGCVRLVNEDNYFIHKTMPFASVCDGMGGHQGGSIASLAIVEIFQKYDILDFSWRGTFSDYENNPAMAEDENNLVNLPRLANKTIYDRASESVALRNMGSTLTALYIRRNREVCVINVGDSRTYAISDQSIRQITIDHSLREESLQKNLTKSELFSKEKMDHVITRAVGTEKDLAVDFFKEDLCKGFYLLCSDGLTSMLSDKEIHRIVTKSKRNGAKIVRNLIDESKNAGGKDNITVVLFKVAKE